MSKTKHAGEGASDTADAPEKAATNVSVKLKIELPGVSRSLSAADFTKMGVSNQGKIDVKSGETVTVTKEAATFLCDELGEFELVKPGQKVEAPSELATDIVDTVPDGVEEDSPAGSSGTGANTRDGAGSTSPGANINR